MSKSREVEGLSCSTCSWNKQDYCPIIVRSGRWSDNLDYCSYYQNKKTRFDIVQVIKN